MFKKLIGPVQKLLLKNGQCVGCGRSLSQGMKVEGNSVDLIKCGCGRIFVKEERGYRRALFEEVK